MLGPARDRKMYISMYRSGVRVPKRQSIAEARGSLLSLACVNDLVLVTVNKADLRGFRGLRVEGWERGFRVACS